MENVKVEFKGVCNGENQKPYTIYTTVNIDDGLSGDDKSLAVLAALYDGDIENISYDNVTMFKYDDVISRRAVNLISDIKSYFQK